MTTRLTTGGKPRSNALSAGGEPAGAGRPWPGSSGGPPSPRVVPILDGSVRGVAVAGELDPATVSLLNAAVGEVCRAGSASPDPGTAPEFFLNLREVTFLDAAGLFVLGRIHEQVDGCGDVLRVAAPLPAGPRRALLLAVTRGLLPAVFSPWSS